MRPSKQRELAKALQAHVIKVDADHDLPLVKSDEYARLTKLAVDTAAAAAGHDAPATRAIMGGLGVSSRFAAGAAAQRRGWIG